MLTKNVAVHVKATAADDSSLEEGQFTALASVFGNVDAVGDVVLAGAFSDTLAEWKASGANIPLYWAHRMDDPAMCIGQVLDAKETDTGLQVKAALDLDNANGAQVYRLLKGRRVNRMSFAYDVLEGAWVESEDKGGFYELRKLKLHEVSVVQVPANDQAAVQDVKQRRHSKAAATDDTKLAGLLGQADQAVDDAGDALEDADTAMDAVMDLLGVPDTDDEDTEPDAGKARHGRRKRRMARLKAAVDDVELAGLVGQADQAIDDATDALEDADAAMDAVLAHLGVTDTDDEDTEPDAGKARRAARKAGRVLSAKNEKTLRGAVDKLSGARTDIKAVLAALEGDSTDEEDSNDGKASPTQPATAEAPPGGKASEPARPSPASFRLRTNLAALAAEYELTD